MMISTLKNSLSRADSLPNLKSTRSHSSVNSSFSNHLTNSSDILSTAVLHKRRKPKRVRFALKLESVEEDSMPSSRETSISVLSKSNNKRVIDPWRQNSSLYGAYVEYLEKQDALTGHESQIRRTLPPPPPPAPEPGAEPPTYTHTFVIKSKSPEVVIDSITVSTPPFHLPRILHHTKKTNKYQSPSLDSYVKQQINLSTSPRIIHSKKLTNVSSLKNPYSSVHAALKRAELALPPTNGLHTNNKLTRSEISFGSKIIHNQNQPKKMTEVITRPLPGANNQINHFSDRSILPNYTKKSRMHNRNQYSTEGVNTNIPYFYQNHNNDHISQPIIHSNR